MVLLFNVSLLLSSFGLNDAELEEKLEALVKGDIISQGQTHFDYRGVQDNIFDKVFRGVYEKEIREFDVKVIRKEYSEELEKFKKQYNSLKSRDLKKFSKDEVITFEK